MFSAFLNSQNDVLAIATVPRTLEEVQNKLPDAIEKIENAPIGLKPLRPLDPNAVEFHRKDSGDGTDISHYIVLADLDAYKDLLYKKIDKRTQELISAGFDFDNETFSMSMQAQMNWNRLRTSILTGVLTALDFPRDIATISDESYTLITITDASDFFAAHVNRLEERLRSGRQLKNQIRQATTKAEVDAISDNRTISDPPENTISAKRQELLTTNYVDWKYEVVNTENGKIQSVKRYTTDNNDGTYSGLVQEELYSYQGNKLISITTNTYDSEGNIELTETETFHSDGTSTTVRKFS